MGEQDVYQNCDTYLVNISRENIVDEPSDLDQTGIPLFHFWAADDVGVDEVAMNESGDL